MKKFINDHQELIIAISAVLVIGGFVVGIFVALISAHNSIEDCIELPTRDCVRELEHKYGFSQAEIQQKITTHNQKK